MRKKTLVFSLMVTIAVILIAVTGCGGNHEASTPATAPQTTLPEPSTSATTTQTTIPQASTSASVPKIDLPGASTADEAAHTVIDLIGRDMSITAQKYFMEPGLLDTAVDVLDTRRDIIAGEAEYVDAHSAGVEVFLPENPTTPALGLHMWRVQVDPDKWKVKDVTVK